jgi:drug/metabolite transporter (DMT)-like permease
VPKYAINLNYIYVMTLLSKQHQGSLYTICSGFCYGFIGYFGVTLMNSGLSVSNMLFWRFFISTISMLIIVLPYYKDVFKDYKEGMKVLFYGVAFYSTSAIIYFIASTYIGSGLAMVICFTYPAIVMLFNIVHHKAKLSKTYSIAFALLIVGMLCLIDMTEAEFDIIGIGLGILSAIFYAGYIVVSKKSSLSPIISTFMVSIGCMITCLIASLMDQTFALPDDPDTWFHIVGIAVVCTTVPILLFLKGLKYISSEKASMLSVLEPVFVIVFGIVLLDESITNMQVVGTIIVLSGALITMLPKGLLSQRS